MVAWARWPISIDHICRKAVTKCYECSHMISDESTEWRILSSRLVYGNQPDVSLIRDRLALMPRFSQEMKVSRQSVLSLRVSLDEYEKRGLGYGVGFAFVGECEVFSA